MPAHTYHDDLPGFDERQVLHDGCPECEHRSKDLMLALGQMDVGRFAATARRALVYRAGDQSTRDELHVAKAERYLLDVVGIIVEKFVSVPLQ